MTSLQPVDHSLTMWWVARAVSRLHFWRATKPKAHRPLKVIGRRKNKKVRGDVNSSCYSYSVSMHFSHFLPQSSYVNLRDWHHCHGTPRSWPIQPPEGLPRSSCKAWSVAYGLQGLQSGSWGSSRCRQSRLVLAALPHFGICLHGRKAPWWHCPVWWAAEHNSGCCQVIHCKRSKHGS